MNNITGSGYSVSQFASNLQYRAWGTLKSETYGNGFTENAAYNGRLQLTSFEVRKPNNDLAMSSSHQYYADGALKFSNNGLDERFDRAFRYDHVGRAAEAYSGSEARDFLNGTNTGSPTGPYRQSYQYNPFNGEYGNVRYDCSPQEMFATRKHCVNSFQRRPIPLVRTISSLATARNYRMRQAKSLEI